MDVNNTTTQLINRAWAEAGFGLKSTVELNDTTSLTLKLGDGNAMNLPTVCTINHGIHQDDETLCFCLVDCLNAVKRFK